jgi:hypothetical protein
MTVKVTQITLQAMTTPADGDLVQVSQVFVEVLADIAGEPPVLSPFAEQDVMGFSPGGLDVWYVMPSLSSSQVVTLRTNVIIGSVLVGEEAVPIPGDTGSLVQVENRSGACWIVYRRTPGDEIVEERKVAGIDLTVPVKVRINYHENHITVYLNGRWGHTYSNFQFTYPSILNIYLKSSANKTLTDIVITELHDWRHAIFTETEADGASILGSIIQERPIEMYVLSDGTCVFFYNVDPAPTALGSVVRSFDETDQYNDYAASDFILYYRDVATKVDTGYLDQAGFITKILRLSGLDNGAEFAGGIIARRMREREQSYGIVMRPDLRVEAGDVISLSVTESGTGAVTNKNIFVEQAAISLVSGNATMTLKGRLHAP